MPNWINVSYKKQIDNVFKKGKGPTRQAFEWTEFKSKSQPQRVRLIPEKVGLVFNVTKTTNRDSEVFRQLLKGPLTTS